MKSHQHASPTNSWRYFIAWVHTHHFYLQAISFATLSKSRLSYSQVNPNLPKNWWRHYWIISWGTNNIIHIGFKRKKTSSWLFCTSILFIIIFMRWFVPKTEKLNSSNYLPPSSNQQKTQISTLCLLPIIPWN